MKTDWSKVADWYDDVVGQEGSEYHREVVLPGVLRLLAVTQQERVLDIACGQGVLCRLLQERGAEVTGIDASGALIDRARQRSDGSIHYHVADAREMDLLSPVSFDAAACVLAIQNIHPIQSVFTHVSRCLRDRGRFVIVMMHPCYRAPGQTSWGWDEQQQVQYRRVDGYLLPRKMPIVAHPGSAPDVYTWTFHKPIGSYVKALRQAGLLVDALEEWPSHKTSQGAGPRARAENNARQEIPMFLALRAVRISSVAATP